MGVFSDGDNADAEINVLIRKTTSLFNHAQVCLNKINKSTGVGANAAEISVRKNVQRYCVC